MNNSPTVSQYIYDQCDQACAFVASGDLFAAAGIQAGLELSTEFGAPHAARIVELTILIALKTPQTAGAAQ